MSRSSGFVPIRFRLAGKLLLIAGIVGLVLTGVATVTSLFALPSLISYMSLVAIPVGIYMIIAVPKED